MKKITIFIVLLISISAFSQQGWYPLNTGTLTNFNSVYFYDSNTGYAVGDSGRIVKTLNGGVSWNQQTLNINYRFNSIVFTDVNTGYICGDSNYTSSFILKTTTSGLSWFAVYQSTQIYLNSINFINPSLGFAGGYNGTMIKTTDGGNNWQSLNYGSLYPMLSIHFTGTETGYAVGGLFDFQGMILKTSNGGINWVTQFTTAEPIFSVNFLNDNTGYAAGGDFEFGITLFKTTNGGTNWSLINSSIFGILKGIRFTSPDTGYCAGINFSEIYKTTNGGNTWFNQNTGSNSILSNVFMLNSQTGYAVGTNGLILKTTNGGIPPFTLYVTDTNSSSPLFYWTKVQNTISYRFQISTDPAFLSTILNIQTPDTFYRATGLAYNMCFYSRVIADTSTWSNVLYFCTHYLTVSGTVHYIDNNQPVSGGYVKALELINTGQIVTVDSVRIQSYGTYSLIHVHQDSTYIMAYADDVDAPSFVPTYYDTTIYWRNAHVLYPTGNMTNIDIHVFRANPPSGPMHLGGGVFTNQTSLVGLPNSIIYAKSGIQYSGYSISGYNGVYRIDSLCQVSYNIICDRLGYNGGTKNVSLSSANQDTVNFYLLSVIGVEKINQNIPSSFKLYQNYPNPFNPVTTIKFDIPKSSNVKLVIYDLLGKEVIKLFDDKLNPGTYNIEWNAINYSSGVYFYKLIAGDYTITKKLVLIK